MEVWKIIFLSKWLFVGSTLVFQGVKHPLKKTTSSVQPKSRVRAAACAVVLPASLEDILCWLLYAYVSHVNINSECV